jgi:MYXO-CTERM domain-containing protein
MHKTRILAVATCAMMGVSTTAQFVSVPTHGQGWAGRADEYSIDDGMAESIAGFNGANSSIAWLNQFTVTGGLSTITAVSIAFGQNFPPPPNGTPLDGAPLTVFIWADPNNDGNPSDAVVLHSVNGVVANSGTDIFNSYAFPNINVGPNGTSFFIGAIITQTDLAGTPSAALPARLDTTPPSHMRSWLAANQNATPVNPNSLGAGNTYNVQLLDDISMPGNWMIRASAIPAPGALALLGLGGLGAARRRR